MSVDLSLLIPNKCRSLRDKEDARKCFNEMMERIVRFFHGRKQFIKEITINEQEEENEYYDIEYSFEIPLLNITVYLHAGYWDIWPVASYCHYFIPYATDMLGKPCMWARYVCFNTILAFGQKEGWICDEYHSWNSGLEEKEDTTFEDWKTYGESDEDSSVYEFEVMDFADVDPYNKKWPDYQSKYHDNYKDCFALLNAIKKVFPEYDILSIEEPLEGYVVAAKDDEIYFLNYRTGESLTDFPIDDCRNDFNGAGFQIFRGEQSAFFCKGGKQLTEFRIGDFSWEWDVSGNFSLRQIITDKATGRRFFTDGTPAPDKTDIS